MEETQTGNRVWATVCWTKPPKQTCTSNPVVKNTLQLCFSGIPQLTKTCPESLDKMQYDDAKVFFKTHTSNIFDDLWDCPEEDMLHVYNKHWQQYSKGLVCLKQLLAHINDTTCVTDSQSLDPQNEGQSATNRPSITDTETLALNTWTTMINNPLQQSLTKLLLKDAVAIQAGFNANLATVQNVFESLFHLDKYKDFKFGQYQEIFEAPFLKQIGENYKYDVTKFKCCLYDRTEYTSKVFEKYTHEKMCCKFLHPSTAEKVQRIFIQYMVADELPRMKRSCEGKVLNKQWEECSMLYLLLHSVFNGLSVLVAEFEELLKREMLSNKLETMKQHNFSKTPEQFVKALLALPREYSDIVKHVFRGDHHFLHAMARVSATAIKPVVNAAELVADYSKLVLRKKEINEAEEKELQVCLRVSAYLEDKDEFMLFLIKHVSKRLLSVTFPNMNDEIAMVSRLTTAFGPGETRKLTHMIQDMTVSESLNKEFKESLTDTSVNFSVKLLRASSWPLKISNDTYIIPFELERPIQMFNTFYNNKFEERQLKWQHGLCNTEVELNYLPKKYVVNLGSTFQLSLFLQFNEHIKLSKDELGTITKLPESDITRHLQSLLNANLIVESAVDKGVFFLNMSFKNKHSKLKVMNTQVKQGSEETEMQLANKRKYCIQASIVRIMKSQRVLQHNLLIQEVISQCRTRFCPGVEIIKESIEELISREYIKRVEGAVDQYAYIP